MWDMKEISKCRISILIFEVWLMLSNEVSGVLCSSLLKWFAGFWLKN